jgi:hypothetical protein
MSRNIDIINIDFKEMIDAKLYELEVLHFNYIKEMNNKWNLQNFIYYSKNIKYILLIYFINNFYKLILFFFFLFIICH